MKESKTTLIFNIKDEPNYDDCILEYGQWYLANGHRIVENQTFLLLCAQAEAGVLQLLYMGGYPETPNFKGASNIANRIDSNKFGTKAKLRTVKDIVGLNFLEPIDVTITVNQ